MSPSLLFRIERRFGAKDFPICLSENAAFPSGPGFKAWRRRRHVEPRYGAVGKYGSLAAVERPVRSVKDECTSRIRVPLVFTWSCCGGGEGMCGRCESCARLVRALRSVAAPPERWPKALASR